MNNLVKCVGLALLLGCTCYDAIASAPRVGQFPMPRRKFTAEEDMRLRGLVEQYGCNNWKVVATQMLWRDAKQCREHWKNYLSPSINLAPWTDEEEELLKEKVAELGPKWAKIAKFFSGRTDTNIKNRWGAMQLRQQRLLQ